MYHDIPWWNEWNILKYHMNWYDRTESSTSVYHHISSSRILKYYDIYWIYLTLNILITHCDTRWCKWFGCWFSEQLLRTTIALCQSCNYVLPANEITWGNQMVHVMSSHWQNLTKSFFYGTTWDNPIHINVQSICQFRIVPVSPKHGIQSSHLQEILVSQ